MSGSILIYGAYGFTGSLIAERLIELGERPIIAGRNRARTKKLAQSMGLTSLVFDLKDRAAAEAALETASVVVNCAGPFADTWDAIVSTCINTKTHYIDITGEIDVISGCASRDQQAKAAGITLLPGAGFDVVPTDCLSAMLARNVPSATHLTLAFTGMEQASHGTLKTMLPYLPQTPLIRKDGQIVPRNLPLVREVDFGKGPQKVQALSWGDVASAWYTTGIGNIEVFMKPPPGMGPMLNSPLWLRKLLASNTAQPIVHRLLKFVPAGPNEKQRTETTCTVYGCATDKEGHSCEMVLRTPDGYNLTSHTAPEIAIRLAKGNCPTGYQTPAQAFGADFILQFDGCKLIER